MKKNWIRYFLHKKKYIIEYLKKHIFLFIKIKTNLSSRDKVVLKAFDKR